MSRRGSKFRSDKVRIDGKPQDQRAMYAPMRPECNADGIMMANKPLDPSTFRRMFVFASQTMTLPGHPEFIATGMPVMVDLKQYETKSVKRPGWAFNRLTDGKVRRNSAADNKSVRTPNGRKP